MGFLDCRASAGFLTRYERELREPLMWCQGSQVSMHTDEDPGENTGTQRGCVMLSGGEARAKAPECQWGNGTQL